MTNLLHRVLLIAALGCSSTAFQDTFQDTKAPTVLERARSMDKLSHSFVERVAIIVEEGVGVMPLLENELQNDRADRFVLAALGFLATEADVDVVRELAGIAAKSGDSSLLEVIDALLRIGGTATDELLARAGKAEASPKFVSALVGRVWLSPRPADLQHAKEAFERQAVVHPDSAVRALVSESGIPRVDLALQTFTAGREPETLAHLANVLQEGHTAFVTVTGGVAVCWAADKLVDLGAPSAAREIRSYLQGKEARGVELERTSKKRLLLAIERSNTPLNTDEANWLASVRELDPRTLTPGVDTAQLMLWLAEIRKTRGSEREGK
jgi:hypothetical protein